MKIEEISSPYIIETKTHLDNRGVFSKLFDNKTLILDDIRIKDVNIVSTLDENVFRGFHWQTEPYQEYKILRCIKGKILDLCIDLKAKTGEILEFNLDDKNNKTLIVPPNFAHGYITLTKEVTVIYATTAEYAPNNERGIRWNDPKVRWSYSNPKIISEKDSSWNDWITE